jgi:hypothetical protein
MLERLLLANPIATPSPTKTQPPSIRLRFALPSGVGLSALQVHAGDTITEGQTLAAWPSVESTPHPSATPPLMPMPPPIDGDAGRELEAAQAALDALTIAQAVQRDDLIARQRQEIAEQQRARRGPGDPRRAGAAAGTGAAGGSAGDRASRAGADRYAVHAGAGG